MTNINKVVKKLKKLSYGIYLPNLSGDTSKYSIIVFCDAALNNLPGNVGSTQAFIIFLECEGKVVPLSWSSKKIARVCKVILHAECMALSVSVDQALVLKETLIETVYGEKKGPSNIPINVFTDCYSLFQNITLVTLVTLVSSRQGLSSALQEVPGCWLLSIPKYYYYWLRHNLELEGCLGVT